MKKDNKIVKSIMWGASAMLGFVLTDKLYQTGVKYIDKNKENEEEEVIFEEESEESQ